MKEVNTFQTPSEDQEEIVCRRTTRHSYQEEIKKSCEKNKNKNERVKTERVKNTKKKASSSDRRESLRSAVLQTEDVPPPLLLPTESSHSPKQTPTRYMETVGECFVKLPETYIH